MSWNRLRGEFSTEAHQMAPELYTSTSSFPYLLTASSTIRCTLAGSRVSTGMAVASPPASLISRSTVLMVDCWELGFGGHGFVLYASEVVLPVTTTRKEYQYRLIRLVFRWNYRHIRSWIQLALCNFKVPCQSTYFAKSMATCLPMPLEAPTTSATCFGAIAWFRGVIFDMRPECISYFRTSLTLKPMNKPNHHVILKRVLAGLGLDAIAVRG